MTEDVTGFQFVRDRPDHDALADVREWWERMRSGELEMTARARLAVRESPGFRAEEVCQANDGHGHSCGLDHEVTWCPAFGQWLCAGHRDIWTRKELGEDELADVMAEYAAQDARASESLHYGALDLRVYSHLLWGMAVLPTSPSLAVLSGGIS